MRKAAGGQNVGLADKKKSWHAQDIASREADSDTAAEGLDRAAEYRGAEGLGERGAAQTEVIVE
ncbi:MAG: hypothetical protein JNN08_24970 [Bryobacterales bacterium]|nr:hypothetical protein [Bryobacterales bacterium]